MARRHRRCGKAGNRRMKKTMPASPELPDRDIPKRVISQPEPLPSHQSFPGAFLPARVPRNSSAECSSTTTSPICPPCSAPTWELCSPNASPQIKMYFLICNGVAGDAQILREDMYEELKAVHTLGSQANDLVPGLETWDYLRLKLHFYADAVTKRWAERFTKLQQHGDGLFTEFCLYQESETPKNGSLAELQIIDSSWLMLITATRLISEAFSAYKEMVEALVGVQVTVDSMFEEFVLPYKQEVSKMQLSKV